MPPARHGCFTPARRPVTLDAMGLRIRSLLPPVWFGWAVAWLPGALAQDAEDPFVQVTSRIAGCPEPAPPSYKDTADAAYQARFEAHTRGERGTSCYQSGRCRLPNSYLYDKEIIPRVQRFIRQDSRFAETSVWIAGQRRWVYLQGCVKTRAQADDMVNVVRTVDDVERVVDQLFVLGKAKPPYRQPAPAK
jgi:hypothetical protein